MSLITIKENDTARTLTDTLTLDGSPINLAGATVVLVWRLPDGTVNRRDATVVSATAGTVSYAPLAEDVADAGLHRLEWEVTLSEGGVLTIPSSGYIRINVIADLG